MEQKHVVRKLSFDGTNWKVETIAGSWGNSGSNDGIGNNARFNFDCSSNCYQTSAIGTDSKGNIFVADEGNHTIRKISYENNQWVVSTIVGQPGVSGTSSSGWGASIKLSYPNLLTVDKDDNIFIMDKNGRMLKIFYKQLDNFGMFYWGGLLSNRFNINDGFYNPVSIVTDDNNNIYIMDKWNSLIRKLVKVFPAQMENSSTIYETYNVIDFIGQKGNMGTIDGDANSALLNGGLLSITPDGYMIVPQFRCVRRIKL